MVSLLLFGPAAKRSDAAMADSHPLTRAKLFLLLFTSTTADTRPGPRVTSLTTSCSASPALEDSVFKIIIVIYIIYVMSIKIASWVAGNVVTFREP